MLTISNYKSIEFLSNLVAKALDDYDKFKSMWFENYKLDYYKVANEWASTFNDLGLFETIDDVLYYLEKPYKLQEQLYIIKMFDLSIVYKQDYSQWLKDIDCPKECEMDTVDFIEYVIHNGYQTYQIKELLDECRDDFKV